MPLCFRGLFQTVAIAALAWAAFVGCVGPKQPDGEQLHRGGESPPTGEALASGEVHLIRGGGALTKPEGWTVDTMPGSFVADHDGTIYVRPKNTSRGARVRFASDAVGSEAGWLVREVTAGCALEFTGWVPNGPPRRPVELIVTFASSRPEVRERCREILAGCIANLGGDEVKLPPVSSCLPSFGIDTLAAAISELCTVSEQEHLRKALSGCLDQLLAVDDSFPRTKALDYVLGELYVRRESSQSMLRAAAASRAYFDAHLARIHPVHISAVKMLGDIHAGLGDHRAAFAAYDEIMQVVARTDAQTYGVGALGSIAATFNNYGYLLEMNDDLQMARHAYAEGARWLLDASPDEQVLSDGNAVAILLNHAGMTHDPVSLVETVEALRLMLDERSPVEQRVLLLRAELRVARYVREGAGFAREDLIASAQDLISDTRVPVRFSNLLRAALSPLFYEVGDYESALRLIEPLTVDNEAEDPGDLGTIRLRVYRGLLERHLGRVQEARARVRSEADRLMSRIRQASHVKSNRELQALVSSSFEAVSQVLTVAASGSSQSDELLPVGTQLELVETVRSAGAAGARMARWWASLEAEGGRDDLMEMRGELRKVASEISSDIGRRLPRDITLIRRQDKLERRLSRAVMGLRQQKRTEDVVPRPTGAGSATVYFWRYDHAVFGALAEPRLLAFVVKASGEAHRVDLGPLRRVRAQVDKWRSTLLGEEAQLSSGRELRETALDPVLALLDCRSIDFVLDDCLHDVPIQLLPFKRGRLCEHKDIRIIAGPSLQLSSSRAGDAAVLLSMGAIEYERHDLEPLPSAHDEIGSAREAFADRFGDQAEFKIRTGPDATREYFLSHAPSARAIHIVTHGVIGLVRDSRVAELAPGTKSRLVFAVDTAPGSSSVLSAHELARCDLTNCELAVFAACNSALGIKNKGQSVASIRQAAHDAGARVVLSCLWPVEDSVAARLVGSFFRRHFVDGLEPRRALAKAQHDVIRGGGRGVHSRDWAAWVVTELQ